jgi:ribosomal protein S18 acetylase RimI-like enzyme
MPSQNFGLLFANVALIVALADAYQTCALRSFAPASYAGVISRRQSPALNVHQYIHKLALHKGIRAPAVSISSTMPDVSQGEIKLAIGFEEKDRESLAQIIWPAFHTKADWIYEKNVQKQMEVMRVLPMPENTIVAKIDDKIVGLLNFKTCQTNPVNKPLDEVMTRHRNWRSIFFLLLEHKPENDEFYIFMLAVSEEARGAGVGKKLLHKAYEIATEQGLKCATLHVIQENLQAKRLYLREGFVDVEQLSMPWYLPRRVFPFKAAWFQRKALA